MIERVRKDMFQAKKAQDNLRGLTLSLLLQALQKTAKEKNGALTQDEADAVVMREIKQTQETLALCPKDRAETISECQRAIEILSEYAPKQLSADEIETEVMRVLAELNLPQPTLKDKGRVMKVLMPRIRGKADGKLVNSIVTEKLDGGNL